MSRLSCLRSFVPRVEALEPREVPAVTVIASGLEGSQGSAIGPGGDLYVTEGAAGRLSRIDLDSGAVTTVASGLPVGPFGGFGGGAVDVAFRGGKPYVLVTAVAEDVGGPDVVGIYRVDGPTSFTVVADIGAWSITNPPDTGFFLPTGNQYAMEPFRGGFLVTDGNHNRVLQVDLDGTITEVKAFDNVVPTGLAVQGNTIYTALAGPAPHLPEDGQVVSFLRNRPDVTTQVAAGAPLLTDVEFGPGNRLYALSMGVWEGVFEGDPPVPDTGAFLRANRNGTFTVLEGDINRPTSLEFVRRTAYIVTYDGEVLRVDDCDRDGGGRMGLGVFVSGGGDAWGGGPAGTGGRTADSMTTVQPADGGNGRADGPFGHHDTAVASSGGSFTNIRTLGGGPIGRDTRGGVSGVVNELVNRFSLNWWNPAPPVHGLFEC
jgi:hypothetical protein